jgi:hypothetical protein
MLKLDDRVTLTLTLTVTLNCLHASTFIRQSLRTSRKRVRVYRRASSRRRSPPS